VVEKGKNEFKTFGTEHKTTLKYKQSALLNNRGTIDG